MKFSSTEYFEKLGKALSYRFDEGPDALEFPEIAGQLLEEMPPPVGLDFEDVFAWALSLNELPEQVNFHSGFGQPPLVVYEEPRFYIELLFWFPSRTAIHGHGFHGAYVVVAGYSIETTYQFVCESEPCEGIKIGELKPKSVELIAPGKVNRILAEDGFIHSVAHLGNPSMTLVIRNRRAEGTRQFDYLPGGLAFSKFHCEQTLARQTDLLRAQLRRSPERFVESAIEFVRQGDPHRLAIVLNRLGEELDAQGEYRLQLMKHAKNQFGAIGTLIGEAFAAKERSRKIWAGLELLAQPEMQLMAVLREFFPEEAVLHRVLGESFSGSHPDETLSRWRNFVRSNSDESDGDQGTAGDSE